MCDVVEARRQHALATVDRRTDVYALGRIGVVLLAESGDAGGGWWLRPGVPDAVGDVLRTAEAQDPADRYPDASAFRAALADATAPGGPRAPRASARQEAAGPDGVGRVPVRDRRRVVTAAVSLALALAGAAAVAWSWSWSERDTSVAASDDDRVRVRLTEGWRATGSGARQETGTDPQDVRTHPHKQVVERAGIASCGGCGEAFRLVGSIDDLIHADSVAGRV